MKNKLVLLVVVCALCMGLLTACGNTASTSGSSGNVEQQSAQSSAADGKIKVVCTIFPSYDWVKQLVGGQADKYEISYLVEDGVDLHSYQPTVQDIARISDCDLFVYVGGESDAWVEGVLSQATNDKMRVVNLLETLGDAVVAEELVEGMQEGEHAHEHADEATEEEAHEHADEGTAESSHEHADEAEHHYDGEEVEYDEHVWLSLRNAQVLVNALGEALAQVDAANAATYQANAKAYGAELESLDEKYQAAVDGAKVKTVLFADRFPFRYLVDDYGLDYYAAFVGCSAETEASFETIAFLAQKIDELGLPVVFCIDGSDQKIAQTVVANTKNKDQQILVMDSMQSTTADDVAGGATYLKTMEENLTVLEKALS